MSAAHDQLSERPPRDAQPRRRTRVALTIAGSDSGGGAGIQADLKAFARCGVHGACAITAITAQSTMRVDAVEVLSPQLVLAQARAVLSDLGADAVKVGMLGSAEVARAVAGLLRQLSRGTPVVVDPVMLASSGARLLDEEAAGVLRDEIVPQATVITPNVPEAHALLGDGDGGGDDRALVRALAALGPRAVVLTGGHRERSQGRSADLFIEGAGEVSEIAGEHEDARADHGSGCTHSAVLTAQLALGSTPLAAARRAHELAARAIAGGHADVGRGRGPVDVLDDVGDRSRPGDGEL